MMENISKHITYKEATYSNTAIKKGIDNSPSDDQLNNMRVLAVKVFEKCIYYFQEPIYVTSFFRSLTLNSVIGGSSKTSQHCSGEAMDIRMGYDSKFTNKELFEFIKKNLDYDQLIWEFGTDEEPKWIHVSYNRFMNRKMNLRAVRRKGKTKYIKI